MDVDIGGRVLTHNSEGVGCLKKYSIQIGGGHILFFSFFGVFLALLLLCVIFSPNEFMASFWNLTFLFFFFFSLPVCPCVGAQSFPSIPSAAAVRSRILYVVTLLCVSSTRNLLPYRFIMSWEMEVSNIGGPREKKKKSLKKSIGLLSYDWALKVRKSPNI